MKSLDTRSLLLRLQVSLLDMAAFGRERIQVGPFVAMLHRDDPMIYMNYAIAVDEPDKEHLDELIKAFRARNRRPRFEYFDLLWPSLGPMLESKGFEVESRTPVMALTEAEFVAGPDEAEEMADLDTLSSFAECVADAFGEPMSQAGVASSLDGIHHGRLIGACIRDEGRVVSGGFMVGGGAVAELAGIGTRKSHERRGFASRVSRNLCRRFFDRGGELAWLSAGSDQARAVYERLGFVKVGEQVNISMPE